MKKEIIFTTLLVIILLLVTSSQVNADSELSWKYRSYGSTYLTDIYCKIDSNNKLHIVFSDPNTQTLHYGTYNGYNWDIETVKSNFDSWGDENVKLDLDSSNRPHIIYEQSKTLYYMKKQSGSWSLDIVDSTGQLGSTSFDLEVDSSGRPHIVYNVWDSEPYNHWVKYAVYSWGWDISIIDSGGNVGVDVSLALDYNDKPHVLYCELIYRPMTTSPKLWYAYLSGSNWINELLSQSQYTEVSQLSIDVDSNNKPHICFSDSIDEPFNDRNLKYANKVKGYWEYGTIDSSGDDKGSYCDIVVDNENNPHVTYGGEGINYGYNNGNSWELDKVSSSGETPTIDIDEYNLPHICYKIRYYSEKYVHYAYKQPTEPDPPKNLGINAYNDYIRINWNAPDFDGGVQIENYHVFRGTSSNQLIQIKSLGTQKSYSDYNIEKGTTYYYQVTASNDFGESSKSNKVSETIPEIKISNPSLDYTHYTDDTLILNWDSTNAGDYVKIELYYDGSLYKTIMEKTYNDGLYEWAIPSDIEPNDYYEIKITDTQNSYTYDSSEFFRIEQNFIQKYGTILIVSVILILVVASSLFYFKFTKVKSNPKNIKKKTKRRNK